MDAHNGFMKRSYLFALIGLLLGTGAPIGALILLWLFPHPALQIPYFIEEEWKDHVFFFTYMLVGTSSVFTLFGFWIGQDHDKVIRHNRRLTDQAQTDPLTGLGNHRYLHKAFSIEHERHRVNHQPLSCLMMDLDHFKRVNDSYGHPFGDYVLQHFAKIVQESIRQGDIATRYGGEEFFCILPNCDNVEALQVADRIRRRTEKYHFVHEGRRAKVTVSLGCVTSHRSSKETYSHLIKTTDKSLYAAKHKGRNRVVQGRL